MIAMSQPHQYTRSRPGAHRSNDLSWL